MKKVLVITGSPRKGGNSDMLASSFADGVEENGNEVMRFDAGLKKIAGCTACCRCGENGKTCVIDDDFNDVQSMLETADVLVFISPLYWFGVSSQLKALIDRIHAYSIHGGTRLPAKESVLIMCGETDDMNDFTGAVETYRNMGKYLKWEDRGVLLIGEVNKKGDVLNAPGALGSAKDLGLSI